MSNNINSRICNASSVFLYRNGKSYGPYSANEVLRLVECGKILLCDKVSDIRDESEDGEYETVRNVLKAKGLKAEVESAGGIVSQLTQVGRDLLLPSELLKKETWTSDGRLLLLTLIGMFPLIGVTYIPTDFLKFYAISLYFSSIWAMFFYSYYKTKQVQRGTTLKIFFFTQIAVFVLWDGLGLPNLNIFYHLTESDDLIGSLIGFIFGVGFTEELGKMLVLIWMLRRAKEPMVPQTIVFYGLISGLAFGVFEGVQYQLTVNSRADYAQAYYLNIARMTTLPFVHAIWTALAGFFLSFANLYPRYRKSLYLLAISIPAITHGLYDTFCGVFPLFAYGICILCVGLLNHYLGNSKNYQSRLR